ncbi:MAG: GNAT family N-acetyltransferase [Gammaproteobacteria bacterium]|nr:GNAT family N-acetyltransferase [Gammaproteobacteria bacterium]MCW8911083.1 GNAT family N-acetyltransferase [Gammaproteobacteria bacterium]MCW9005258.1 GNAT family N-acetyltransferase [Gammaproteobacteria bacterium]MCW9056842.1 GNAT family N-acetyltransferase [Gammaproteobacteria bacterium]
MDSKNSIDLCEAVLSDATHAQAIINLLSIYALDPMGGGESLSDYTKKNLIAELTNRSDNLIVLAFDKDIPVGLVNCFEGFSTFLCKPLLNLHDVVVHPEYRGRGISTMMLKKIEELARSRDYCKLTLEVLEGNMPAKAAYLKSGFKPYQLDPEMGQALFWEKKLD